HEKPEQRKEIYLKLPAEDGGVFEQFRPGVLTRLGIDYEAVRARNPKLVYCSLSGFGHEGRYRHLVAHDPNYLALHVVIGLIGRRDAEPVMTGPQLADISAAHMVAIGILLALRNVDAGGDGDYLDISLFDSAFSLPVTALASYFGSGTAPSRGE